MIKFFDNIKFWYTNARPYSVPLTILSWLVAFLFAIKHGGTVLYGLIALVGISFVHLATNLADDYFDYKRLSKDKKYLDCAKDIKCKYLKTGQATVDDLRSIITLLLLIAAITGVILFFTSGWHVVLFAFVGLIIALSYSWASSRGLGDIAVILAYGPLMFEGVYYVMTSQFSTNILILSLACSMLVNTILYAHMLMDFDEDITSGKTTLCTKLKTKKDALMFLSFFYIIGYSMLMIMSFCTHNFLYMLALSTIPLVFDLYKQMKTFPDANININFLRYPFLNSKKLENNPNAPFLLRFIYTRNISVYFMLLVCVAIIFD